MKFMNKKCQVFTPEDYVEELLNSVGYVKDIFGKKILENSCGDGKILMTIIERYICDCKLHKFTNYEICKGLSNNIYGIEIDPLQHNKCIQNLNKLVRKYGM